MSIHWNSLADFLAMGGYGTYVWGSFGVTALIMLAEPILAVRRRKSLVARLQRQLRAERANSQGSRNSQNSSIGSPE
jgi:heme exporter protein D